MLVLDASNDIGDAFDSLMEDIFFSNTTNIQFPYASWGLWFTFCGFFIDQVDPMKEKDSPPRKAVELALIIPLKILTTFIQMFPKNVKMLSSVR